MSRAQSSQSGLSLVESLVSMTLFLFVLLAVLQTYAPNREIHASGERKVDVQQNARFALAEMAREIRMAGYFPENFASPAADPALANPIRVATEGTLALYGDSDGDGASTVTLYCLDGEIVRRAVAAVDSTAAYTCTGGEIIAEKAVGLRFNYYDADNNPIPSPPGTTYALDSAQAAGAVPDLSDTTQRDSVRKVVITLTTMDEAPHREPHVYALRSEVSLRNGG